MSLKMSRPRPALNIVVPASRYVGFLSEEYMSAFDPIRSGFLEFLLQQQGVPLDNNLHLLYSIDHLARFRVSVLASSWDELDQFYGTIMQVMQPFLLQM